jgi:chitosanase
MTFMAEKKQVIDQIISLFETGKLISPSAYSTCAILKDGAGISYGKHQGTDKAGSLDRIVLHYIDAGGTYAEELKPFLALLKANVSTQGDPKNPSKEVQALVAVLKKAGSDPIMQRVQDEVFDEGYWLPAVSQGKSAGLVFPLTYAVLYDTCIHSGPGGVARIRQMFAESPPARGGNEKAWTTAYIKARRKWLASSSNPIVRNTVYRMDAFLKLIADDEWDLNPPMVVRNTTIPG